MSIARALVCMMAAQDPSAPAEPARDRQEPGVTTGTDRGSALRIQLTGHVDLHYAFRAEEVDIAASVLNTGVATSAGNQTFWAGRIGLRADVEVKDLVTGVI